MTTDSRKPWRRRARAVAVGGAAAVVAATLTVGGAAPAQAYTGSNWWCAAYPALCAGAPDPTDPWDGGDWQPPSTEAGTATVTLEDSLIHGGEINDGTTTLFVYVQAGEKIVVDLGDGGNSYDESRATARLIDPSGTAVNTFRYRTTGPAAQQGWGWASTSPIATLDAQYEAVTYEATEDGVWALEVNDPPNTTGIGANFPWRVLVYSETVTKQVPWWPGGPTQEVTSPLALPGRVFTESLAFNNADSGSAGSDYRLYAVNENGSIYEILLRGYNGIDSTFTVNNVGNVAAGTTESALRSVPETRFNGADGPGAAWDQITEHLPGSVTPYRIFLDYPADELPESADSWADGRSEYTWVNPVYEELDIVDLSYARTATSSNAGELTGTVVGQTGTVRVRVDTDGNGSYTDAVDVDSDDSIVLPAVGDDGAEFSWQWDGLDGQGAPVPTSRAGVRFEVAVDDISPVHFTRADTEWSIGGIEIRALTGPSVGNSTVYWNDAPFAETSYERYTYTDGWWPGDPSSLLRADGIDGSPDGVDSTGGVHRWEGEDGFGSNPNPNNGTTGSWGDARVIDDWAYEREEAFAETPLLADLVEPALSPELKIDKATVGVPTVSANRDQATITWTIQTGNFGAGPASDVVVQDVLPSQLVAGSVEATDVSKGNFDVATGTWQIGELADGETVAATVTATVALAGGTATTTVVNDATVTSPDDPYEGGTTPNDDLDSDDDQFDRVETPITPELTPVDLRVNKALNSAAVISEDRSTATITWLIETGNRGDSTATDVVLTDVWPEQVVDGTIEATDVSKGNFDVATGTWQVGELAKDEVATATVTATIELAGGTATTTVVNDVTVTSTEDPYEGGTTPNDDLDSDDDQFDRVETPITPDATPADLRVNKATEGLLTVHGDGTATLSWLIEVGNFGESPATQVELTDTYPTQLIDGSAEVTDLDQGAFDSATGIWDIGTLGSGATVSATVTATVVLDPADVTVLRNAVTVTSIEDPYEGGQETNEDLVADDDQYDHVDVEIQPDAPVGPQLPHTGGSGAWPFIGGGLGLLLTAAAAWLIRARRQSEASA